MASRKKAKTSSILVGEVLGRQSSISSLRKLFDKTHNWLTGTKFFNYFIEKHFLNRKLLRLISSHPKSIRKVPQNNFSQCGIYHVSVPELSEELVKKKKYRFESPRTNQNLRISGFGVQESELWISSQLLLCLLTFERLYTREV